MEQRYKRWDTRTDGRVFWQYLKGQEIWKTPDAAHKARASKNASSRRSYATPAGALKTKVRLRRWRTENPVKAKEIQNKWRATVPDKVAKYHRSRYLVVKADPAKWLLHKLRVRLQKAFDRNARSSTSRDKEAVKFLMWLKDRKGITDLRGYQIDHLFPVSKATNAATCNVPENVRLITERENNRKRDREPTEKEVAEHLALVAEWRNSFLTAQN